MKYVSVQEVIMLQEKLISRFGGSYGIREINLLKSSVENVFQTFEKEDLYTDVLDKRVNYLSLL